MQLRNFELEGKMKIQKKKCGPPAPLPGEEEWCAPPLLGGGGREGGGAPRELLPQGAAVPSLQREGGPKDMPRAGRPEPHTPKNTPHRGKGVAGETAPLPLPSPPHPEGAVGPGSFVGIRTAGWALLDPGLVMVLRLFTSHAWKLCKLRIRTAMSLWK